MQLLLELQKALCYFFHICSSTPPQDTIYYVELVELPFNSVTAFYASFMSCGMDGKDGKYSITHQRSRHRDGIQLYICIIGLMRIKILCSDNFISIKFRIYYTRWSTCGLYRGPLLSI